MRGRVAGACVFQCGLSVLAVLTLTGSPAVAQATPPNDAFANAQVLAGSEGTVTGSTVGATREPAEPVHAPDLGEAGEASVWYTWSTPVDANVELTLSPTFRGVLAAYTGDDVGTLERVPGSIAEDRVSFSAGAGIPYRIAVAGLKGESGSFALAWSATAVPPPPPPPPAPVNDNLADAVTITGGEGSVHGSNVGATMEPGEPDHSGQEPPVNGASVWWSWTAPATGEVTFSTEGSGFDTILAVFDGPSFLSVVAVNDDAGGLTSEVSFTAEEGHAYYVQVLGWRAATGLVSLSWQTSGPPANDDLANAQVIEGLAGTSAGSTRDATAEDGEPQHGGAGVGQSVWWRWTAPADARVTFSTEASPSLTVLAVYTGTSLADLTLVGANVDAIPLVVEGARLAIDAQEGEQYLVAVDTSDAANEGPVVLRWDPAPANDQIAGAEELPAPDGSVTGTLVGGSRETGEPRHGRGTGGASTVWYRWTAPRDGVFRFTTTGSERDVVLSAYTGGSVTALVEVAGDSASQESFPFPPNVSVMTLPTRAGTTYAIAAADHCDGFCRGYGALRLDWTFVPPPANDRLTAATEIGGVSGRALADNLGATKEVGEPDHAGVPGGGSVWYRWTAPHSGRFTFDALRSHGSHSVLDVYTGASVEMLTPVPRAGTASLLVSDSPSHPLSARRGFASFDAVTGQTYLVAVDTRDTTLYGSRRADIVVAWDPAPANDDLAAAVPLASPD
ncbi:MAG TPA: PPC domain-containing protein, partial [Acidimicrobiales bacterium]|nr:PPC domain-containing protein [Acidimicrobiales bacterium]